MAVGVGLYGGRRAPAPPPPLTIRSGGRVARLVLSPDGRLLADEPLRGQVLLYDTATGRQKYALSVRPYQMVFSQDGSRLLTLCSRLPPVNQTGAVQVWDTATGAQVSRFVPLGQAAALGPNSAALSQDLHWVVVCGGQNCAIYDTATGGLIKTLPLPSLDSQAVFSPDSGLLAIGGGIGGGLQIWDTKTWRPVHAAGIQAAGVSGIRFSPDGARLALGSAAGLAWWNTHTWKPEGRFALPSPGGLRRDQCYFSSDGRSLLVRQTSPPDALHQVDCATGRETLTVPGQELQHTSLTGDRAETCVVAPGKYQYLLYRASYDIWDTARRQVLYQITPPPGPNATLMGDFQPHSTDLSADGHVFAAGGFDDGVIQVWRLP